DDHVEVRVDAPRTASPNRVANVTVRLKNNSRQDLFPVQTVFTIQMPGLPADGVLMSQGGVPLARSGGDGAVVFTSGLNVRLAPRRDRGDTTRNQYQIVFTDWVPSGRAEVIAEAFLNGERLGGGRDQIRVRGGQGAPPTTTPPNTDPGIIPTFAKPSEVSLAPLEDTSPLADFDPGLPPYFYLLGVVLLATGGALLWLLYRQRGQEAPAGGAPAATRTMRFPGILPWRGGDRHTLHQPTTVLPTVSGPPVTPPRPAAAPPNPPPVDPWATPPIDKTREFDPFQEPPGRHGSPGPGPERPSGPRHARP
ncbi:MAG TPA: hypothetical protein VK028_14005, partial [Micromonosporaceae bacterium]|nr:hypothetical protein [Micromonosporaceae bacterium]